MAAAVAGVVVAVVLKVVYAVVVVLIAAAAATGAVAHRDNYLSRMIPFMNTLLCMAGCGTTDRWLLQTSKDSSRVQVGYPYQ